MSFGQDFFEKTEQANPTEYATRTLDLSTNKCPHCGVVVDPSEEFCSNCFCDLRAAAPQATQAQMPDNQATQQQAPAQPTFEPGLQVPAPNSPPMRQPDPSPLATTQDVGGKDVVYQENPPPARQPEQPRGDRSTPSKERDNRESVVRFRPRLRAPMATLLIYDDDQANGEVVRIRTPEVTIGRAECDVEIPHEKMMSGQHAKITCQFVDGQHRWFLEDLESTNGTYLRVLRGKLRHNSELLLGAFRYRFDAAPQGAEQEEQENPANAPQKTMGWSRVSQEDLIKQAPSLVRITPRGETDEFKLPSASQSVGVSRGVADVAITDDPMLSDRHVKISQDEHQRWYFEDLGSTNGVWVAIKKKELDRNSQFQLGEQRFSIRFP